MALVLFDLDNTLLAGDSDHLWGTFLVEQDAVDADYYRRENDRFYQDYKDGTLDIYEFLRFSLRPLRENSREQLLAWREQFLHEKIDPIIPRVSRELVEKHRVAGDTLAIITATNAFITAPIAERFGIEHLIATLPEQINGHYTGEVAGEPCYKEGKVIRLNSWLEQERLQLGGSWFYSDSHNDLPLLRLVDHPVAVDPDAPLLEQAEAAGWPIISLRDSA